MQFSLHFCNHKDLSFFHGTIKPNTDRCLYAYPHYTVHINGAESHLVQTKILKTVNAEQKNKTLNTSIILCLQQTQVKMTKGCGSVTLQLTPLKLIYVEANLCNEAPKNYMKQT